VLFCIPGNVRLVLARSIIGLWDCFLHQFWSCTWSWGCSRAVTQATKRKQPSWRLRRPSAPARRTCAPRSHFAEYFFLRRSTCDRERRPIAQLLNVNGFANYPLFSHKLIHSLIHSISTKAPQNKGEVKVFYTWLGFFSVVISLHSRDRYGGFDRHREVDRTWWRDRSRAEGAESRCLVRSEPKPKGLLGFAFGQDRVERIKTVRRPDGMIILKVQVARRLFGATTGLVAGNVTGGGGKATKTKT